MSYIYLSIDWSINSSINPSSVIWKGLETMTNPVAMSIYSIQIVVLKYHFLLKATGASGAMADCRSMEGNIQEQPEQLVLLASKEVIKDCWDHVKRLRSQLKKATTSQRWANFNFKRVIVTDLNHWLWSNLWVHAAILKSCHLKKLSFH